MPAPFGQTCVAVFGSGGVPTVSRCGPSLGGPRTAACGAAATRSAARCKRFPTTATTSYPHLVLSAAFARGCLAVAHGSGDRLEPEVRGASARGAARRKAVRTEASLPRQYDSCVLYTSSPLPLTTQYGGSATIFAPASDSRRNTPRCLRAPIRATSHADKSHAGYKYDTKAQTKSLGVDGNAGVEEDA